MLDLNSSSWVSKNSSSMGGTQIFLEEGSSVSVDTLIKMADFLGTSTDYLLGRINDDMPLLSIKKNGFDVNDLMLLDFYQNTRAFFPIAS